MKTKKPTSPEMVPVPSKSPVRMGHPAKAWKVSICLNVQYAFFKFDLDVVNVSSVPANFQSMLMAMS